jgi:hypothetical protein
MCRRTGICKTAACARKNTFDDVKVKGTSGIIRFLTGKLQPSAIMISVYKQKR